MKLLAIAADIDSNNLGGAEWHFVEVLKRIAPKFEMITVIVGPEINIKERLKDNSNIQIIPIKYPHITNFYGLFFIFFSIPRIFSILKKEHYDLIWAKQEYPQGVVAGILKIVTGLPIYLTCQSAVLHKDELVIKGRIPDFFKSRLADLAGPLINFAFDKADAIGAVSHFSETVIRKSRAKRIEIVPNGVDLKLFETRTIKRSGSLKCITTSSLIYRNGVDDLIKACKILDTKVDWQLKIAGDGPQRGNYEKLARELEIEKKIEFLGRVPSGEIPRLLSESDVFIRLSRAEGFGSSFIEAMAAGVPVVGTNIGGITDYAENQYNCLLVSPGKPEEAAEAIMRIEKDQKLAKMLIANGLKTVSTKYSWDKIAEKIYSIMNQIHANV